jgi:hypothetical protein
VSGTGLDFGLLPVTLACFSGDWQVRKARALLKHDPQHWRERAAEARAVAEKMTDEVGRQAMVEIAEKYEKLAERALLRIAPVRPSEHRSNKWPLL